MSEWREIGRLRREFWADTHARVLDVLLKRADFDGKADAANEKAIDCADEALMAYSVEFFAPETADDDFDDPEFDEEGDDDDGKGNN